MLKETDNLRRQKAKKTREKIQERATKSRRYIDIDTSRRAAIYARQSTEQQIFRNETSHKDQTEGQQKKALALGFAEDSIDLFDDMAISGTTDIEDREGLRTLLQGVRRDLYSVVICFMEDRLFRDEYLDNATKFARACGESGCLLVTERYTYDLSDEMERERFFMEVRFGWAAYKNQILGHLLERKALSTLSGNYDGRVLPVGYTVCRDKDCKYFKRLSPLSGHAEVVNRLFYRFVELGGNISQLAHELRTSVTPHFPATEDTDFNTNTRLKEVQGGYRITDVGGLKGILSNPVYVGAWKFGDTVVVDNHLPIVSDDLFYHVQTLLEYSKHKPYKRYAPSKLLLNGKITAPPPLSVTYQRHQGVYAIQERSELKITCVATISTEVVESTFFDVLTDLIRHTSDFKAYYEHADKAEKAEEQRRRDIEEAIEVTQGMIDKKKRLIEALAGEPDFSAQVKGYIKEVRSLNVRIEELQEKLSRVPREARSQTELLSVLTQLRDIPLKECPFEYGERLVAMSVKTCTISSLSSHFMKLVVEWKYLWKPSTILFFKKQPTSHNYTPEEDLRLKENYGKVDCNTLCSLFPCRPYNSLETRALGTLKLPFSQAKTLSIPRTFTLEDRNIADEYEVSIEEIIDEMHNDPGAKGANTQWYRMWLIADKDSSGLIPFDYEPYIAELKALIESYQSLIAM